MINIIASVGKNHELGRNGNLIWYIKDDLIFFRNLTINHDIIMGRKTFESLPRVLDKRHHVVLTRGDIDNEEVEVSSDIKALILRYKNKDVFVIGGASIYKAFINYSDNIYLTEIDDECAGADTFFPKFNKDDFYREILKDGYDEKLDIKYKHVLYKKKR